MEDAEPRVSNMSNAIKPAARGCLTVADRLRDLIDLVVDSLDEHADGRVLAERAGFSRDHLDRIVNGATGESPVALRRRLLLERAAWQLRAVGAPVSVVATSAGYGSLAAFSRAFSRAYGTAPTAFAAAGAPVQIEAPNGIHFHPPAGLLLPGPRRPGTHGDLTERAVRHHLERSAELLRAAEDIDGEALDLALRPGFLAVWFEGEEASAALMAERLVHTLEVWVAATTGTEMPAHDTGPPLARLERVGPAFERVARSIRDRGAWDDAFIDALCEPPQSFTYGGVMSHVLTYGAVRREMLASVLTELGAELSSGDPLEWERRR